ncbi:MotA/TolQ/ExbB proton channel family protein [Yoonia sp. GPGPB17]|uniref:MotA/TolQ/ExbB proton channel family protein n=1 Tax=Yoonia sp. GPGPB17 TaxID=3026147 RepID=UPI0030BB6ACE
MNIDLAALRTFLDTGGPALWVIAALSVITLAVILWKIWQFFRAGVWASQDTDRLYRRFATGVDDAMHLPQDIAREEIERLAHRELGQLRSGLRPLDLIVTIAPLIGLLGTVLGMIAAFRILQESGGQADPSLLAGGIWEALLTTAAGMSVAIPAAVALSWFEGIVDHTQAKLEDMATQTFTNAAKVKMVA